MKNFSVVKIFRSLGAILGASVICVCFSRVLYHSLGVFLEDVSSALLHLAMLGIVLSLGLGLYLLTTAIFRLEEVRLIREQLK
jgi:hypothetical protein